MGPALRPGGEDRPRAEERYARRADFMRPPLARARVKRYSLARTDQRVSQPRLPPTTSRMRILVLVWMSVALSAMATGRAATKGVAGDWLFASVVAAAVFVLVGMVAKIASVPNTYTSTSTASYLRSRLSRPLAVGWLLLVFGPTFSLGSRTPSVAAQGGASVESVVEIGAYMLAAATSAHIVSRAHSARYGGLLWIATGSWVAWIGLSTLWSHLPLFTLVRAFQFMSLMMYALAFKSALERSTVYASLRVIALPYVAIAFLLTVVSLGAENWVAGRLAWPFVHPGLTGMHLGVIATLGFVMASLAPRGGRSRPLLMAGLGAVGVALTGTRTAVLALGFVLLGSAIYAARGMGRIPWAFSATALVMAVTVNPSWIVNAVTRGESFEQLRMLGGRIDLWETASAYSGSLAGFGFGAARVLLPDEVWWGGTAHSAWMELLIGVGRVGAILAGLVFVGSIAVVVRSRFRLIDCYFAGFCLTLFLAPVSITSEAFAVPGVLASVLFVVVALLSRNGAYPSMGDSRAR